MSRFYASILGNRGEGTRKGTATSGIKSHTRGWNVGAVVSIHVNEKDEDCVSIVLTGGSNNPSCLETIGTFTRKQIDKKMKGVIK